MGDGVIEGWNEWRWREEDGAVKLAVSKRNEGVIFCLRNQYHCMGGLDIILNNCRPPYTKASDKCGCRNAQQSRGD
jgi:hypothetical protein